MSKSALQEALARTHAAFPDAEIDVAETPATSSVAPIPTSLTSADRVSFANAFAAHTQELVIAVSEKPAAVKAVKPNQADVRSLILT